MKHLVKCAQALATNIQGFAVRHCTKSVAEAPEMAESGRQRVRDVHFVGSQDQTQKAMAAGRSSANAEITVPLGFTHDMGDW
eukprot:CAMPEP_0117464174 /NCGR_PEP_ID=MMETSP0784-20121206/3965_1 /TAXON_ID=39447 /ORGANISM="" /LENGTH=81 /DNA_ID=CAMNT_0005258025 /DNA_START=603 /DNA_END=844 /DNA_ORIENTATION=-